MKGDGTVHAPMDDILSWLQDREELECHIPQMKCRIGPGRRAASTALSARPYVAVFCATRSSCEAWAQCFAGKAARQT